MPWRQVQEQASPIQFDSMGQKLATAKAATRC